jgi:hypothetical protein
VINLLDTAHFGHEGLSLGAQFADYGISPEQMLRFLDNAVHDVRTHSATIASELTQLQDRIVRFIGEVSNHSPAAAYLVEALADAATRPDQTGGIALLGQSRQQVAPLPLFVARALDVSVGQIVNQMMFPMSAAAFKRSMAISETAPWREVHVIDAVDQETLHALSVGGFSRVVFHASARSYQKMLGMIDARLLHPSLEAFRQQLIQLRYALSESASAAPQFSPNFRE